MASASGGRGRGARRPVRARLRIAALAAAGLLLLLAGLGAHAYSTLPEVGSLATRDPSTTALIEARAEEARAAGQRPRRRQRWVALGAVAPRAVDAVLLSEDAGFYLHEGVDTGELKKALEEAWERKELGRGASTITQQLAKNLWLSGDRSLLRKAKELLLARRLEEGLTKKRILALYLNVAEWGDGIYGIEAGAEEHFGVAASALTVGQGAILAAMLPAPRRYSPEARSRPLRRRAVRIVERLLQAGRIDAEQAEAALAEIEERLGRGPAATGGE